MSIKCKLGFHTWEGWHLPTEEEWLTLYKSLGDYNKEIYDPKSKLNCLKIRHHGIRTYNGKFYGNGSMAEFWSSTPDRDNGAVTFHSYNLNRVEELGLGHGDSVCGLSIRLFRD